MNISSGRMFRLIVCLSGDNKGASRSTEQYRAVQSSTEQYPYVILIAVEDKLMLAQVYAAIQLPQIISR